MWVLHLREANTSCPSRDARLQFIADNTMQDPFAGAQAAACAPPEPEPATAMPLKEQIEDVVHKLQTFLVCSDAIPAVAAAGTAAAPDDGEGDQVSSTDSSSTSDEDSDGDNLVVDGSDVGTGAGTHAVEDTLKEVVVAGSVAVESARVVCYSLARHVTMACIILQYNIHG